MPGVGNPDASNLRKVFAGMTLATPNSIAAAGTVTVLAPSAKIDICDPGCIPEMVAGVAAPAAVLTVIRSMKEKSKPLDVAAAAVR